MSTIHRNEGEAGPSRTTSSSATSITRRPRGILEVDDADDVAEMPVHFRGAVDVAAIEGEAMHPAAGEARDALRIGRTADIVDLEPAAKARVLASDRKDFAIDEHHAVFDPHLVRQRALGNGDLRKLARLGGIADVDDARAVRRRDVADICDPLAHDHLPAAITIEVADDLYAVTMPAVHAQPDRGSLRQNFILRLLVRSTNGAGRLAFVHAAVVAAHSITASARAMSVGGISRPSAFAVLRLMTSSNRVGCNTGRSAQFVSFG